MNGKFLLAGLNHRNAPVELREQVAITAEELPRALQSLRADGRVAEAMILSTCNRVELMVAYQGEAPDLPGFLIGRSGVDATALRAHMYLHRNEEAVRHLFRVAASLDSMVVGEPQILGQVKEAFATARLAGAVGPELERLLQQTFSVAKRVRNETGIATSSVSIASVAVDLALQIFGSLAGKRVLLVGAGKMGELAARHLLARGASSITVANRTLKRAERLAQSFGGQVLAWEQLADKADAADILITSTGSHEFIFHREDGQRFLQRRRGRPMFLIDIAVPRDVDPAMNRVDGIFLYDIDDLQSVAQTNLLDRSREAALAERVVEEEVLRFTRRTQALDAVPTLLALQGSVEAMRQAELRRASARLESLTPSQREAVETLTRGLANKFLHAPLQALRAAAQQGDRERLSVLRDTFHLEVPERGAPVVTIAGAVGEPAAGPDAPEPAGALLPVARRR